MSRELPERRIVVVGGGLAGREAARQLAATDTEVLLITRGIGPRPHLDHVAARFLASVSEAAAQAWEPEGPAPGTDYAPALRETLVGALDTSARNYRSAMVELEMLGVRIVPGIARLSAPDTVTISLPDGGVEDIRCSGIILATGSEDYLSADSPLLLTADSMSELETVPESMLILGSSPSALEIARMFAAYGSLVTVVGARRPALESLDPTLRPLVSGTREDEQIRILPDVTVTAGTANGRIDLLLSDGSHIDAELALSCGEGASRTEGLGLENVGVRTGSDGEILTDEYMRTDVAGIFAISAVTGCFSATTALVQAKVAARTAAGAETAIRYHLIPYTAWFSPQFGAVGLTEEAARDLGAPVVNTVYMTPEPGPERWVKVISDAESGRITGLHIVGDGAVEAAHAGALAIHAALTTDELADLACAEGSMFEAVCAAVRERRPTPEIVHPLISGPE